jgi:hypothetical protein
MKKPLILLLFFVMIYGNSAIAQIAVGSGSYTTTYPGGDSFYKKRMEKI